MPTALDAVRYFGEYLSDNIAETPEGFLICRNAVIGRSGFQKYKVSEVADPKGILGDDRSPDEEVELWRDAAEVFSPATIASFEGKTLTFTHPRTLLDASTDREHSIGHIQNVRRGTEALDSGDIPILADIIVKDESAIRSILDDGIRELSCGYSYRLAKEGYRYDQRGIVGNHVALVQKGRAGDETRINDAAPTKEITVKNPLKYVLGLGLTAYAKDAKPEELAEMMSIVGAASPKPTEKFIPIGKQIEGMELFMCVALDTETGEIQGPTEAMDKKKRMHDALDRMMAESEEAEKKKAEAEDASVEELQSMLNKALSEAGKEGKAADEDPEAGMDAHVEGCKCTDCMDKAKDADPDKPKDGEEAKDGEVLGSEPIIPPADRPKSQFDVAMDTLNILKPQIAASKNPKLIKAFDAAVQSMRAAQKKAGTGSYGAFRAAASTAADAARDSETTAQKEAREYDATMKKIREEGRARNISGRKR